MAEELVPKQNSWVDNTRDYFQDIRAEMKRVTWPNRTQVESTTVVVILSVFLFAAYFAVIDKLLQETVQRAYNYLIK
jgi:preprotein translocase subunit SecE